MTDTKEATIYTAPPIVEAVVQIIFSDPLSENEYRKITRRLGRKYANGLDQKVMDVKIEIEAQNANFVATSQMRFSSNDQTDVLTCSEKSFIWSRLAPYEGWDAMFERVKSDLESAYEVTGYNKLERVGVRYINRLDLPAKDGDIIRYEDYLAINISVPSAWVAVDSYAWRLEKDFGDFRAIIQSATAEAEVPDTAAFILDIDVITRGKVPAKMSEIWGMLQEMRTLKNEIFEISIIDTARKSFSR